jgi:hypothetical protein
MTLQPLPSEFPYILGKFYFLFYQCPSTERLKTVYTSLQTINQIISERKNLLELYF